MHIIVQAGGKGTRLEGLTRNKPKCLVPFDNLPLIFHLFERFRGAKFSIIADYKIDVLRKYLAIFAKNYNYKIIHAKGSGTASGIAEAIEDFDENESFLVIWCDLILSREFKLPQSVDLARQNANFGARNLGLNLALSENSRDLNLGENLALNLGENSSDLNLSENLSDLNSRSLNLGENLALNSSTNLALNLNKNSSEFKVVDCFEADASRNDGGIDGENSSDLNLREIKIVDCRGSLCEPRNDGVEKNFSDIDGENSHDLNSSKIKLVDCFEANASRNDGENLSKFKNHSDFDGENLSDIKSQSENLSDFKVDKNFVGISGNFECRWSFVDGKFVEKPSFENGVAGLFIFANKKCLKKLPKNGALVEWLQSQSIDFTPLALKNSKEIGTLLVYTETNPPSLTRPFNRLTLTQSHALKTPITAQGRALAKKEIAWYKFVKKLNFAQIPEIFAYEPLKMKRIQGRNIFEYECLLKSQKIDILKLIIAALKALHALTPPQSANLRDVEQTYFHKTFERLELVKSLVPFADKEFIKINGRYYKNALFEREKIAALIAKYAPGDFHLIHGDCTFSNILFDSFNQRVVFIDPRGYFGDTAFYGDSDYDWAKLYYSICGDYDQFNRKKFTLLISENEVEFMVKSSAWSDVSDAFFDLCGANKDKIKLLHALIWLSLTSYAWEDYDSICAAFYRGTELLGGIL